MSGLSGTATGALVVDALTAGGLDPDAVDALVRAALAEDLALGPDVTTEATVPASAVATGDVVARRAGVLAGVPVAAAVLHAVLGRRGAPRAGPPRRRAGRARRRRTHRPRARPAGC